MTAKFVKRNRIMVKALALAATLLATLAFGGADARAEFQISEFGSSTSIDGAFTRQAGAHPDFVTTLKFNELGARTAIVELPPGLTANPTAAPTCTQAQLVGGLNGESADCPVDAQVGYAIAYGASGAPVYNIKRPPDMPGLLGFNIGGVVVTIKPRIRGGDYGITSTSESISQALRVEGVQLRLWGVPADDSHDSERVIPPNNGFGAETDAPPRPFITNPTACDGTALRFEAFADSWWDPGIFSHASLSADEAGIPFITEGCERLRFEPSMTVKPDSRRAGGPMGLNVTLNVPQNEAAYGFATPQVRNTVVTLPQGVVVSPSVAQGLSACSPAQVGIGSEAEPKCPPAAAIGTVSITSPLLDEDLNGDVYVATQKDNPFGSLLALYMVVRGPGILLKLPGRVDLDQQTGQLTVSFENTPQLPFETLRLSMFGGNAAPLAAPAGCGTYSTHVAITSWASDDPVELDSPMTIDEGCDTGGFDPKLRAGTADPSAGGSSPFTLQVTRGDSEQNLSRIDATLPEGLLAKLAGVPLCGDAAAATGECPAASRIGKTTVGAGAGSNPVYVPEAGRAPTAIYLAGPYKGAPYSLVVKVPAQAGPFDLGTVAVRSGIYIDPVTTRASVKSDPLPQILQGIPIAYRDVRVEVDRDGFMLNPTSCETMKVESTLFGAGGATASPSANFQAANCAELGFKPKLALKFSGPTHRSAHPKLKATLTTPTQGANIGKAVVTLPETEFLENAHIRTICTRVQYAADQCPKGSVYGYAKAWTPLLNKPLQGPVYLRSSNHTLPDLVASLDGAIHVDLAGRIDSPGGKIRNTFWAVPDAPVSKFVLTMQGGDKGLLVNNEELCNEKPRARAEFTGQNGKRSVANPLVKTDCGKR